MPYCWSTLESTIKISSFIFLFSLFPQILETMRSQLLAAEEKKLATISELSLKHQKVYIADKLLDSMHIHHYWGLFFALLSRY